MRGEVFGSRTKDCARPGHHRGAASIGHQRSLAASQTKGPRAISRAGPSSPPDQKSQSSSSVASALPMTYDEPDPEKKSWFSSALGDRADRIAGFTFVTDAGNIAS